MASGGGGVYVLSWHTEVSVVVVVAGYLSPIGTSATLSTSPGHVSTTYEVTLLRLLIRGIFLSETREF